VLAATISARPARAGQASGGAPTPASVVLITLDTVRADRLGCYGYASAETPAIDALAHDAVRFANAYTVVPITLPSHVVMLTGTYPMWNGVRDFTSTGLPPGIPTIAEALKRRGYATAAFVSAYAVSSTWGLERGFETYDDQVPLQPGPQRDPFLVVRSGDLTTTRMLAWFDHHAGVPFFMWLHLYDAHSPYRSPEPYRRRHPRRPYDAAVAFDDAQVGRVIAALRQRRIYDRALIIVASDHGESLSEHGEAEHGFFVYNATLRIPLVVKWPGSTDGARGDVVVTPVSTVQLAATIAHAVQLPVSELRSFQGKPLVPQNAQIPDAVYAESYYPRNSFGWHELRTLITGRFKYIEAPEPELYDLQSDPHELRNLANARRSVTLSLRSSLDDVQRRFENRNLSQGTGHLDPEAQEKLKSLGYVAYQAGGNPVEEQRGADPKRKIGEFNDILRAGDLRRAGKFAEAAQLLSALKARDPNLYVLDFESGENALGWEKPEQAVADFKAALRLNPGFDQATLGLGRAYVALERYRDAAGAFELALRMNPRNFVARLGLAKIYLREGSLENSQAQLARLVAEQPAFAEAHAVYGVVLARNRNYSEAQKQIERGIELGFCDASSLNFLGIARAHLGQPEAAIKAYQEALRLDSHYAASYVNLAIEYQRMGQLDAAKSSYEKACGLSEQLCRQYATQFAGR
jgi:arylsulfatase A-like enzyme/Flp pilus assembly protein TadD